jgi:glyoxylase-like metal-dependent hydrolase (beta-lactamase superfamily II)
MRRLLLVMTLGGAFAAGAQERPVVAKDAGARMERIGAGVYAIVHDDATDEWPHGNTGVIEGDDFLVVIDSNYLPSRSRADIALIKSVSQKPVRYLVNTHWHFDHNNGAIAYREAWPSVDVVSERESRDWIELNQVYWKNMTTAAGSVKRTSLEKLEKQLATGKDEEGKAIDADAKAKLPNTIAQRKNELAELQTLKVVTPNLVFDRELTLTLGKRRIVLTDRGKANSPHDVTIYLPEEKILFTGDILVQSPLPFTGASWPVQWVSVLRELEAVPVSVLVPGHGPVMSDHTYTRQVRELMEAVTTRVTELARQGRTLEQVQAAVDAAEVRAKVPAWSGKDMDGDWKIILNVLVERAWRGVRGQG